MAAVWKDGQVCDMARTTPVNSGYSIITGSAAGSNKAYVDVWLEWKQLSRNTSANTSQVRVILYAACTKSSSTSWSAAENFGYVGYDDGNKQYRSTAYNFANNAVNCFGDYTFTIAHDSDGTKSVTLQGEWSTSHSTYISGGSVSGEVTLETIPRASSITSAADVVLGNACSVAWTPNSSAFVYQLAFSLGDWSYRTGNISPNKTSAYTYNGYTIPLDGVAQQITGSKTEKMSVVLHTYSADGSLIGTSAAKEFTVTVPENEDTKPTVTLAVEAVDAFNGLYLQGKSKLQGTVEAEGQYGATIESLTMKVDGISYEETFLSNVINTSGQLPVVATAVDSRGFTGTTELYVTVQPYYRPKFNEVAAYRCTSEGIQADNGEYLKIEATVDYASVDEKNSAALFYRYRMEGEEAYSGDIVFAKAITSRKAVASDELFGGNLNKESAWSVQIVALDAVGEETVATVQIPCEAIFRHKRPGGKGVGYGGYCEEDDLMDVHWAIRARKGLRLGDTPILQVVYPVGSIYISVVETDPGTLFGGTWERLKDRFLLGAGDNYAAGAIGGENEHVLTVSEMPGHSHGEKSLVTGHDGWAEKTIGRYTTHVPYDSGAYTGTEQTVHAATVSANTDTSVTGGSEAHNNMPPYLTVYMWKRTK